MNKLILTLDEEDLLKLQAILIDNDEPGALDFLKINIAAKIPIKGTDLCDSSRRNPYLLRSNKHGGKSVK